MKRILFDSVLLGAVLVIGCCSALAQGGEPGSVAATHPVKLEIHGQVRFGDTRTPAPNILVRLDTFSGGMVAQILTDHDGKFHFSNLRSMQYMVTVRADGYQQFQQSIDLLTATSDYVNAFLAPDRSSSSYAGSQKFTYVDARIPLAAREAFEKGQNVLADKKFEEAIRQFTKALQVHPAFYEAQLSLGTAYMDLNDWDNAEAALIRATELSATAPNAFFALGELYLKTNRLDKAQKNLLAGLKLQNRSAPGHFALARVYWQKNDLAATGRQLAIALQLNPQFAEAHLLGAEVLLRAGKLEDALTEFQEYLRLAPKGPYAAHARNAVAKIREQLATSVK